jgi:hypothetical protein
MAAKPVTCPSCGFEKNPPGSVRCASCGAKIDDGTKQLRRTREDELARRYQQEGVSVQWLLIAFGVQAVLTGAVIFGLPMVIPLLDFEGQNGMVVCIPVWFLGGLLVGMISPGRTFIEPAVASLLVQSQTVRTMPVFLYLIFAAIGILLTLIGAYAGERIQLGPPPKTAD